MRTTLRLLGVLIACSLVLAACGDDDDNSGDSTATTATTAAPDQRADTTSAAAGVTIKGFAFNLTPVKAGSKVTVKNEDSTTHTFTADDKSFDTDKIDGGKSGEFTAPAKAGDYKVHCEIHSSMTGSLSVT